LPSNNTWIEYLKKPYKMDRKEEKVPVYYVDKNNRVTVECPACGVVSTAEVSKLKKIGAEINTRCRCGTVFPIIVDYRRLYRKKVKLPGRCVIPNNKQYFDIIIEDVSLGGVGFSTIDLLDIKPGDFIDIEFHLNDPKKSFLQQRVEVRVVKDRFIGTSFCERQKYNKELGFFLM